MATRKKDAGFTFGSHASTDIPDYVVAELRHNSGVVVTPTQGIAAPARALIKVLAGFDLGRVVPQFGLKERVLATRAAAVMSPRASVGADYAQSGVMQIVSKNGKDAAAIVARLKFANAVWSAYVAPRPVPAGAAEGNSPDSRNFEPAQGYLHSAPNGIGAMDARATPGATGQGVTICDIEGKWNLSQEDLPAGIALIGGTVIDDLGWRNHGTAVLGEMVARRGTTTALASCPMPRQWCIRRSSAACSTPRRRSLCRNPA